MHKTTNK